MPSAMLAQSIVGRCSSRPNMSDAKARSNKSNPSAPPIGMPYTPARRNTARNASAVAIGVHDLNGLRRSLTAAQRLITKSVVKMR